MIEVQEMSPISTTLVTNRKTPCNDACGTGWEAWVLVLEPNGELGKLTLDYHNLSHTQTCFWNDSR